jgi:hypothetical protein
MRKFNVGGVLVLNKPRAKERASMWLMGAWLATRASSARMHSSVARRARGSSCVNSAMS